MSERIGRGAAVATSVLLLAGCTSYESEYERLVYDYEPIYCYRSLADVACFRTPDFRDERRIVNYYGPAPGKYDRPEPPEQAELAAPPIERPRPAPERAEPPLRRPDPDPDSRQPPFGEFEAI
jgi:hypothetical protein